MGTEPDGISTSGNLVSTGGLGGASITDESRQPSRPFRITEAGADGSYGAQEVRIDPATGTAADYADGYVFDAASNLLREVNGDTGVGVGDIVIAFPDPFSDGFLFRKAGGTDWKLARVVAQYGEDPPRYDCVGVHLTVDATVDPPDFAWQDLSPTVTYLNCFRSPSKRWDELPESDPVLRKINIGQYVLVRMVIAPAEADAEADPPTYAHDGAYEMTPWGGTRGIALEIAHFACSQCVDVGGGVFKIRTRTAVRKRAIYGRDLRGLKKPTTTTEVNIEDDVTDSGPEE